MSNWDWTEVHISLTSALTSKRVMIRGILLGASTYHVAALLLTTSLAEARQRCQVTMK